MKQVREAGGIAFEVNHRDFGKSLTHQIAFKAIVVSEDKGIQSEAQLIGKNPQAVGLVTPVDLPGGEILLADYHARVGAQHLQYIRFVVFAGERQKDAAILQIENCPMERLV